MTTQTPELDTRERQAPEATHRPHPSLAAATIAGVTLAGVTAAR